MRKGFTFFIFLISSSAFALYNGSPTLPEMPEDALFIPKDSAFSMKTNYEGDLVLGRNITASSLSDPNIRSLFNGAEVSFGFIDRVEVYTLLGGFNSTVSGFQGSSYCKLKVKESFGGAIGVRAIGIFWGETKLGFDAKYFYGWPNLESLQKGSHKVKASADSYQSEWQVGAALSQRFAFFTPYIGVNYSRFTLNFSKLSNQLFSKKIKIENTSPFGFLIGLGISGGKGVFFDFEARFFNEHALSAALGLRF
ncbi:MAG: hypothetical protein V4489_08965 [Chlamydiota bacterium]